MYILYMISVHQWRPKIVVIHVSLFNLLLIIVILTATIENMILMFTRSILSVFVCDSVIIISNHSKVKN